MNHQCTGCKAEKPADAFYVNAKGYRAPSCKDCQCAYAKLRRIAKPDEARAADMLRYERDKVKRKAAMRLYSQNNAAHRSAVEKQRYARESARIKQRAKAWRDANPHKKQASNGIRRGRVRQATPAWADMGKIAQLYSIAVACTKFFGVAYHVDHELPLNGATVSGLHVHENLCVIPASVNLAKGASIP